MTTRLLVLGIIDLEHAAYGYKIYHLLQKWQAHHWANVRPGSIYHALAQLEKEKMIQSSIVFNSKESSSGAEYTITPKGHQEFLGLIEHALGANEQQQFAAGLAFMHKLSRQQVITLVRQRLASYQEGCAYMHALPKDVQPAEPSKHPAIIDSWAVLFDATKSWLQAFVKDLEDGRYTFAGESQNRS